MINNISSASSVPIYIFKYSTMILKLSITYFTFVLPIIVYFYLKRNPVTIHCPGCIEDGTIYKCKKGTGNHSTACNTYKTTMKAILGAIGILSKIINAMMSIPRAIISIFSQIQKGITKLVNLIKKLNPFKALRKVLNIRVKNF